jgi:hypothetical protein
MQTYHYAQIDIETGHVISESWLAGTVDSPNMIPIADDFNPYNKKYVDGEWVDYTPEPVEPITPEPTQLDVIEANTSYLVMMMEV